MGFTQHQSFTKACIDKPMSLGRAHINPATITLTFVYQELVQQDGIWVVRERQQVLERDTHYKLDSRRGIVMLIDHPFWQQEGRWRITDRTEPLLYKGQIKHPQRIDFDYEHYAPEEAKAAKVTEEVDQEARQRLGYDLPRYTLTTELAMEPTPFDWDS